jgi:hypothetical protein
VNAVISKRFAKRQQMQWTKRGAHLLLQTRTRTLDGTLRPLFEKWYPGLANDNSASSAQAGLLSPWEWPTHSATRSQEGDGDSTPKVFRHRQWSCISAEACQISPERYVWFRYNSDIGSGGSDGNRRNEAAAAYRRQHHAGRRGESAADQDFQLQHDGLSPVSWTDPFSISEPDLRGVLIFSVRTR